ncbi:acyl--CoA ligase [Candidatus Parcubacteria bacterium]|nr:acyl--CoA ligase [Candidatus Parcubacteria bacterium]
MDKLLSPNFKSFSQSLDHWANKTPDKVFINDLSGDRSYSYFIFNSLVNQAANLLIDQGVKQGDIISIHLRNSVEFLLIYFASIKIGSIINPIPLSVSEKELKAHIDFVQPKVIFVNNADFEQESKKCLVYLVKFSGEDSFINKLKQFPVNEINHDLGDSDIAFLYYSSGTTSKPKGILFDHQGIMNVIASTSRGFGHSCDTVHLGILPMAHTSVMHYSLLPALYSGGSFILAENFMKISRNFWRIIEKHKVNYVQTVPTIIFLLLNINYPDYSKNKIVLPYIACGSAPLSIERQKVFEKKFDLPVVNLYGLSEAGHLTADYPIENRKIGSIGRPFDIIDLKILNNDGQEMPASEVGEIAVKTSGFFRGYYKNKKLYESCFKNCYFSTGDLGRKDKDGWYYFVDRKKDLIIKAGVNIPPNLIDEVLVKHEAVAEASSVGIPDEFFGEVIKSYVVLNSEQKITEKDLIKYCQAELGRFKSPSKIEFISQLPKTASGKILRRELRQENFS